MALKRIQDLDPAAALDGTEIVELEQAGASVQCTTQDIADLAAVGSVAAEDVTYDNAASGLTATEVQAAIDEVAGLSAPTTVSIVTEGSAFTVVPATHSGLAKYVRAAANATFDSAETYTAGLVFNIRATAAVELLEDGVTLTPPAGGTLELDAGMSVVVIMTSGTAGDVIGQTVAA